MDKHLQILANVLTKALFKKKKLEDEHGTGRVSPTLHIQLHKSEAKAILNAIQELDFPSLDTPIVLSMPDYERKTKSNRNT